MVAEVFARHRRRVGHAVMVGQPVILAVFGENAGFHIVDAISKGDQAAPRLPHYRDNNFQGVDNVVNRALAEVGFVLVVDTQCDRQQAGQRPCAAGEQSRSPSGSLWLPLLWSASLR